MSPARKRRFSTVAGTLPNADEALDVSASRRSRRHDVAGPDSYRGEPHGVYVATDGGSGACP